MIKLGIFGSKEEGGFSAGLEMWSKNPDRLLLPCPFCGSIAASLRNTHTAAYEVVCDNCECAMPGRFFGEVFKTISECAIKHEKAINSAIKEWNKRAKKD